MRPVLFQYGNIEVASYPFFFGLGLVLAGVTFVLLLQQSKIDSRKVVHLWFFIAVAIVLGGRGLSALIYYDGNSGHSLLSLQSGGHVLYGALVVGVAAGYALARFWNMPLRDLMDVGTICTPFGIAIGRIGCLLKGCCHGKVCQHFFTVQYPKTIDPEGNIIGSDAFLRHWKAGLLNVSAMQSLPVYPVPIYEFLACTAMALCMFVIWKTECLKGRLILVFASLYCTWRFVIEFIRVNEQSIFGLTVYQIISLIIGGAAVIVLWRTTVTDPCHAPD